MRKIKAVKEPLGYRVNIADLNTVFSFPDISKQTGLSLKQLFSAPTVILTRKNIEGFTELWRQLKFK